MHVALVNIPANAIGIRMISRVADALVSGLQVLAGAVRTDSRNHSALIDIGTAVVLARTFWTQDIVLLGALLGAFFACDTPTQFEA